MLVAGIQGNHPGSGAVLHSWLQDILALLSGGAVGLSLSVIGGGGSILAVPLLLYVIGVADGRSNADGGEVKFRMTSGIAIRLGVIGFVVGTISGFFGIGGGFLIVPGIMFGSGVPILHAIGSSLLSVASFALTTAANYALSGLVDWWISFLFIGGGVAGGIVGVRFATRLAESRGLLTKIFAGVVFTVAIIMLVRIGLRF